MSTLRRRTKNMILASLSGAVIMGVLAASGVIYLMNQQAKEEEIIRLEYQAQIDEAQKLLIDQNSVKTKVIVTSKAMKAGETLTAKDLKVIELPKKDVPDQMSERIDDLLGKVIKIDAGLNTPIISSMVFKEGAMPNDLRNQEYNVLQLPTKLNKGQFVDVRIMFPTGQDYIVLSKKKVKDLFGSTVWHEVNEFEILAMQSAIVDAYIHGAKLYEITYVDPFMQEESIPNYPINLKVIELIQSDPNILEKATISMSTLGRKTIEKSMSEMDELDIIKVQNGSSMLQQQIVNNQTANQHNDQGTTNEQLIQPISEAIVTSSEDIPEHDAGVDKPISPSNSSPKEAIVQPIDSEEIENDVFEQQLVNP